MALCRSGLVTMFFPADVPAKKNKLIHLLGTSFTEGTVPVFLFSSILPFLSHPLSVCLSVCLCACLSVSMSAFVCLPVFLFVSVTEGTVPVFLFSSILPFLSHPLSVCLFVCLCACLSVSMSAFVCLPVFLFVSVSPSL